MFEEFSRILRKYGVAMKLWTNEDDEALAVQVTSYRDCFHEAYGKPVDIDKVWRDREVFMETREDQE